MKLYLKTDSLQEVFVFVPEHIHVDHDRGLKLQLKFNITHIYDICVHMWSNEYLDITVSFCSFNVLETLLISLWNWPCVLIGELAMGAGTK